MLCDFLPDPGTVVSMMIEGDSLDDLVAVTEAGIKVQDSAHAATADEQAAATVANSVLTDDGITLPLAIGWSRTGWDSVTSTANHGESKLTFQVDVRSGVDLQKEVDSLLHDQQAFPLVEKNGAPVLDDVTKQSAEILQSYHAGGSSNSTATYYHYLRLLDDGKTLISIVATLPAEGYDADLAAVRAMIGTIQISGS